MRSFPRSVAAILTLGGLILLLAGCGTGPRSATPSAGPGPGAPAGSRPWPRCACSFPPMPGAPPLWGAATLAHTSPVDAWALSAWDAAGHAPGGLWATHDGGMTWQARRTPCQAEAAARLAAGPGELWMACAGQPGIGQSIQEKTLYRSTDDGRQWADRASYD